MADDRYFTAGDGEPDDWWDDVNGVLHGPDCDGECTDPGWDEDGEDGMSTRTAVTLLGLAVAAVAAFVVALCVGLLDYGSSWPVAAGLGACLGAAHLQAIGKPNAAVIFGAGTSLAVLLAAPAWFADGYLTGMATLAALVAAGFAGLFGHAILGALWDHHRYGRDIAAADQASAKEGETLATEAEEYLAREAAREAPHTLARMAGLLPRQIIGLWGYGGAGKDTAAAGLVIDRDYTRVSFADKLRAFALAQNPLILIDTRHPDCPDPTHIYPYVQASGGELVWQLVRLRDVVAHLGWTEAKEIPEVREFLQRTGTDAGRNVLGEDVWVDAVMADLPEGPLVFTDARFPNEAEAIRAAGGYLVRVDRPGYEPVNAHPSETALADWDFDAAIINEDTPTVLREDLLEVVDLLYPEHVEAPVG